MFGFFRNWQNGIRARRAAEAFCVSLYPGEFLHGSYLIETEAARFIVRVFMGHRFTGAPGEVVQKKPPWKNCHIIAVDKSTLKAEIIPNDDLYQPKLR